MASHANAEEDFSHANNTENGVAGGEDQASRDPCGYYAALGVPLHATPQEIRRAFLSLSQRYHTDKHSNQSAAIQDAMNERFKNLMDAYAVLSDEAQRAAYDAAGVNGPARLALVPTNMRNRPDIIGYVHALERQAELVKTAKLLGATSDISVHYSTVHLFQPQRKRRRAVPETPPAQGEQTTSGDRPEASDAEKGQPPKASTPAGQSRTEGGATPTTAAQNAQPQQPVAAAMAAREVVIDGEPQVILIPSPEMQATLRQRIRQSQGVSATSSANGGVQTERAGARRSRALLLAAVPKKVVFHHSFQHPITPRLGLEMRTDAMSEGKVQNISTTAALEFQQDAVRTYAMTLRSSVAGLKLSVFQQRVLSPIWTLRTKLTVLNGFELLHKLEMTLVRKLTQFTELENGIAWSLFQHGFFKSTISHSFASTAQGISTYIGYHGMSLSAYCVRPTTYSLGEENVTPSTATSGQANEDDDDPAAALTKHSGPAKGKLVYSVNCSPLTGQTHIGLKAWYHHSQLQHFGIGFMTVVPYSVSPLAFPLFLVGSNQHAVVNEVSFLYARGRHRVSIPIIVFVSPNLSRAVTWLGVPILAYRLTRLAYQPYAKAHTAARYLAARRAHVTEVDLARERASLEQHALESAVMVSRAQEDQRGGLVIINARYGVLRPRFTEEVAAPVLEVTSGGSAHAPPRTSFLTTARAFLRCLFRRRPKAGTAKQATAPTAPTTPVPEASGPLSTTETKDDTPGEIPLTLDVTVAVQNLVRDSALTLPEGTKSKLVGFCDPDPYTPEKKELRVMYWFRKKKHVVVVDDLAGLELPQREHLVA